MISVFLSAFSAKTEGVSSEKNSLLSKGSSQVTTFYVSWNAGAPRQLKGFGDVRAYLVLEMADGRKLKSFIQPIGNLPGKLAVPDWKWGVVRFSAFDYSQLRYVGLAGENSIQIDGMRSFPFSIKIFVERLSGIKLIARFIKGLNEYTPGYGPGDAGNGNQFVPNSRIRTDYAALPPVGSEHIIKPLSRVRVSVTTGDGARAESELKIIGEITDGNSFTLSRKGLPDNSKQVIEQLVGVSVQRSYLHRLRMHFIPARLRGAEGLFDTGDEIEVKAAELFAGDEDTGRLEPLFSRDLQVKLGKDIRWWESQIFVKRRISLQTMVDAFVVVIWTGSDDLRISTSNEMPVTLNYGSSYIRLTFENAKSTASNPKTIVMGYYENAPPVMNWGNIPRGEEARQKWLDYMTRAFSLHTYRPGGSSPRAFSSFTGSRGGHTLNTNMVLAEFTSTVLDMALGRGSGARADEQYLIPGLQEDQWDYDGIDILYRPQGSLEYRTLYSERTRSRYTARGLYYGARRYVFADQNEYFMPRMNPSTIRTLPVQMN